MHAHSPASIRLMMALTPKRLFLYLCISISLLRPYTLFSHSIDHSSTHRCILHKRCNLQVSLRLKLPVLSYILLKRKFIRQASTLMLLLFASTKFCDFWIPTILRVLNFASSRSQANFCDFAQSNVKAAACTRYPVRTNFKICSCNSHDHRYHQTSLS